MKHQSAVIDGLVERLQGQLTAVLSQVEGALGDIDALLEEFDDGDEVRQRLVPVADELWGIVDSRRCRSCGCTETSACESEEEGPCGWAEADLCTACVSP